MNEVFLDDLRDKTHRGLAGAAERKMSVGGRAYGYRSEPVVEGLGNVTAVRVLVHEEHATWVRRIFEWYADGKSPRWIAGELNRLKVPSPGARWRRTVRRSDGKWLASAVAGDPKRGVGILNNELYHGVHVWNRTQRVKEEDGPDSFERRPESDRITVLVPELRVVAEQLWTRVKARQREQQERAGARVSAGLTRTAAARTGKRPQYIFSGMCKCSLCGSNFVVSGPSQSYAYAYACATRVFGGLSACPNGGRVPRRKLEADLMAAVKKIIRGEEYQRLFADEVRQLMSEDASARDAEQGARRARIARLSMEIDRYADAIASGVSSATVKQRLESTEAELAQLTRVESQKPKPVKTLCVLPDLSDRYERLVFEAEQALQMEDVVAAREGLRGFMGDVTMMPLEGGGLAAEARLDGVALIRKCLGNQAYIRLVAGAGFEPATLGL